MSCLRALLSLIFYIQMTSSNAQTCALEASYWTPELEKKCLEQVPQNRPAFVQKILNEPGLSEADQAFLQAKIAYLYHRVGAYEKSIKYIEQAMKVFPECGEYYYQQGLCLLHLDAVIDGIRAFSTALKYNYDEWRCLKARCQAKLSLKDYKGAMKDCELMKLIYLDSALVTEAEIFMEQKDYKNAERVLNSLNEGEAHTGHTYFLLSICAAKQKKMGESASFYAQAAQVDKTYADKHILLGIDAFLEGDMMVACEQWGLSSPAGKPLAESFRQQFCAAK